MMKMYSIQSLNKIGAISLIENKNLYVFSTDNRLYKYDDIFSLKWETPPLKSQFLSFSFRNSIYSFQQYKRIIKINKETGNIDNTIELDLFPVQLLNEKLWLEKSINDDTWVSYLNLETNEFKDYVKLSQARFKKIISDDTFLALDKEIKCFSLIDGSQYWQYDYSHKATWKDENGNTQKGSINKIEVFNDTVVLLLSNDTLIGLDIITGKVKWEQVMPNRILTPAAFANGKIYWFALGNNPTYMVVDMASGKIEKTIVPDVQINQRLVFTQPFIADDLILMTSVSTHEIFILNKDSLAIESITKLEGCSNRIPIDNSPQLIDGRVYQLNGDNTLYIFKKE